MDNKINRCCSTCEFNFNRICVGHGNTYKYGETITDESSCCNAWGSNFEYFEEILKLAPWYIIKLYDKYKISYNEFLDLMDKYYSMEPIEINIYDVIEKVYNIDSVQLAKIFNVSTGIIGYARNKCTIAKRAAEFSNKLNLPIKYFKKVTNLDIPEIEKVLLKN